MKQYLDLLRRILNDGTWKQQRAKRGGTWESLRTKALFGMQARYDLRQGFPLVTTKRVPFKAIVGELLWFLSGSTNNNDLRAGGVKIWDEWAQPDGELGPIYGRQWRHWQCVGGGEWDQIRRLIDNIRAVIADPEHPAGRRLILTAWNPPDMPLTHGPSACHTLAQFDLTDGRLSCQMYQRSADMFLGVPFNIASYSLLTHLLAQTTGLQVGEFVHTLGDAHIYENHIDQVQEQLSRQPYTLPCLVLDPAITDIDGIRADQIKIDQYQHHPALPGEVAV